jgi:hypothetical protein
MLEAVIWYNIRLAAKSHLNNLSTMIFLNEIEGWKEGENSTRNETHQSFLKITCKRNTLPLHFQPPFWFISFHLWCICKRIMQVILPGVMNPDFHFSDCLLPTGSNAYSHSPWVLLGAFQLIFSLGKSSSNHRFLHSFFLIFVFINFHLQFQCRFLLLLAPMFYNHSFVVLSCLVW